MVLVPISEAVLFIFGAGFLLSALYLLGLAVAAAFDVAETAAGGPELRIAVLVPAHDEAELIERCVASLRAQNYPSRLFRIIVIADNCSDATAMLAGRAGAEVMVRVDQGSRGKGQALRWAMDELIGGRAAPDAIVVVDADSVADPELLIHLEARLRAGAEVVQAEYLVLSDESDPTRAQLAAAAFLLFHRVRFAGLHSLGLSVALVGNGMAFQRSLLERHPWNAFSGVEDLEYSTSLREHGVKIHFAGRARVYGPMPIGGRAAQQQRIRWEGGRFHVVRHRLPALIATAFRRRDWQLLASALDLAIIPLAGLALGAASGLTVSSVAAFALGEPPPWMVLPWALSLIVLVAYVLVGLRVAKAPPSSWRALLSAPGFLARKLLVYGRLAHGFDPRAWERTARSTDRVSLAGIPIDNVGQIDAIERLGGLLDGVERVQVCTVNLDFLVSAQVDPEVRSILSKSALNLADGMPLVWLARLMGPRLPGRVAGADIVPRLVEVAARRGHSVFLLGGEDGAAGVAAQELRKRYPELVIAGTAEPAAVVIGSAASDDLVDEINASGAQLLLVALGHPKQEKWIAHNRERLAAPIAMGVGCCFDLLAGRVTRAPVSFQGAGLEWLWRLWHEPARLLSRYTRDAGWLLFVFMPGALRQRWLG